MNKQVNARQIMVRAWAIAHQAAARFGHAVRLFIGGALRQAWKEARQMSQKEIASTLDRAASRAGSAAATAKQCWFLAGLMLKAGDQPRDIGCGASNSNAVLTSKQASFWIDQYQSV